MLITVFPPNTVPRANLGKLKKNMKPDAYEEFVATHNCSINHTGSLGAMEAAGLVDCASSHLHKIVICDILILSVMVVRSHI